MKKKNLFWKIFAVVVGVIVIAGLGGKAIDNTKDLFKGEETPIESVETDDTVTEAA